jgi:hypothetical protein
MRFSSFNTFLTAVAILFMAKPCQAQPQSLDTATNLSVLVPSTISLDLFNQILATQVINEFDLLSNENDIGTLEEANAMWNAAILHQWTVAEERQELAATLDQRRGIVGLVPPGQSPFLVCDLTKGRTGDACQQTVEDALGTDQLMVSSNSSSRYAQLNVTFV